MSLLSVCQALAKNVGLAVPDQIVGSTRREWIEAREFASEAGRELARRVDWSALASSQSFLGTGTAAPLALPADFDRLQRGVTMTDKDGNILRPLTRSEWNTLPFLSQPAMPRFFLLENKTLRFWPYPSTENVVLVRYQSKNWLPTGDTYTADDQTTVLDENLLTMALIVRWRRQKGMPFEDFEAEYEAALRDYAGFDVRPRF